MTLKKSNTRVTFVIPKENHEALKEIANYEGRSVSNLLQLIVKEYIENNNIKSNKL